MTATQSAPVKIPQDTLERCARALRVLAHPDRLRIVELLQQGRLTVGELAQELGLPHSAVSQHLNHMKAHGLLSSLRRGRVVYYRVASPHAVTVINCIRRHGAGPA